MRDESAFLTEGAAVYVMKWPTSSSKDAEIPSTIGTSWEADDIVKAKHGKGIGSAK
jgi:hypothetical protein